ncbi:MAG: hypothetical protein ACKVJU_24795 [Verrucomicrobiales bacterium]
MNNPRPKFRNAYEAVSFLIDQCGFSGGWIGPGGMGPDGEVSIEESADEWAKELAFSVIYDLLLSHHAHLAPSYESLSAAITKREDRIFMQRSWYSEESDSFSEIENPENLLASMRKILGTKTDCDQDSYPSKLVFDPGKRPGTWKCSEIEMELCDDDPNSDWENFPECSEAQALEILEFLKPTLADSLSCFETVGEIVLEFKNLKDPPRYSVGGTTSKEDITEILELEKVE